MSDRPRLARVALRAAGLLALSLVVLIGASGTERAYAASAKEIAAQFQVHDPASTAQIDHAAWDGLIARYRSLPEDGVARFDYAGVTPADRAALEAYIRALEGAAVSGLARPEQFAYWANLYNARTVLVILEHLPVESIRSIKFGNPLALGPWGKPLVTVEGLALSLDNIEHDILRPLFQDPRVHYAVNCASIGCPNLAERAFRGATLEADLEAAARAYVNHPRGARIEGGALKVSSIYRWFKKDFGGTDEGVIAHLARYAEGDLATGLKGRSKIDGTDYDWALNGRAP